MPAFVGIHKRKEKEIWLMFVTLLLQSKSKQGVLVLEALTTMGVGWVRCMQAYPDIWGGSFSVLNS